MPDSSNRPGAPRRVLMVAFHFPPLKGSSGIQRTLSFVRHLPAFGWEPLVLTAAPRAYEKTSDDQLGDIPKDLVLRRALAFDTARHLAIGGRYPRALSLPDRWSTWRFDGKRTGLDLIKRYRPDVIWSTYPIATAHMIGSSLAAASGLPWVADFRDPMAQEGYPADEATWKAFDAIERDAVRRASAWVFTTPSAVAMYRQRYRDVADRIQLIENGYDEQMFAGVAEHAAPPSKKTGGRFVLLHSGIIYESERDPTQLIAALGALKRAGTLCAATFELRLRATANDPLLARLSREHDVEDLVTIAPSIPYRQALDEMLSVDALLILQASNCNEQIPAKLYEYARARRPVLALTDEAGDTAKTLRTFGFTSIAPLDGAEAIAAELPAFVARVNDGVEMIASESAIERGSRRSRAQELAAVFERVAMRDANRRVVNEVAGA